MNTHYDDLSNCIERTEDNWDSLQYLAPPFYLLLMEYFAFSDFLI